MTRPMTGQPKTEEELTNATQRANKKMNEEEVPDDIKNHPLTKESLKDNGSEKTNDEKLDELREFRENVREQGNDEIGAYGEPQTDEKKMKVTDFDGDVHTYTRDEWDSARGTKTRLWNALERKGVSYVKVSHWFNDSDVNAVKVGGGFYGHKVGETEKALKFEVSPNNENATAEVREVWIPKKAARTHELN